MSMEDIFMWQNIVVFEVGVILYSFCRSSSIDLNHA